MMPIGRIKPLTWIKTVSLFFIGICGGLIVAAGIFAFITLLQIIPRFASRTQTAKYILFYEDCVILGGTLTNMVDTFNIQMKVAPVIGMIGLVLYSTFSGIFVGCLAIALAEVVNVVPVFAGRVKLVVGIPYLLLSLAIGKCIGTFYLLIINPIK